MSATAFPTVALQIHPPPGIELHAFGFEQQSLQLMGVAAGSGADLAFGVDHAVPGDVAFGGEVVEGVADLAGVAFEAGQLGDLAVGGYAAAWNFTDNSPDELVAFHGRGL